MLVTLHVDLHELHFFELKLSLKGQQIIQNFKAILHGLGSRARRDVGRVLQHLRLIDVVASNTNNFVFEALHILENAVV